MLKNYGDAGNEDRLYGEESGFLEAENYDFEIAGARLLGHDAAGAISESVKKHVCEILDSDTQMEELTNHIIASSAWNDHEHVRRGELLVAKFREGFLQT